MAGMAELPELLRVLDGSRDPVETRRAGDAVARAIVAARPALLALGTDALEEPMLADARAALDRAEQRIAVRWDTQPTVADVVMFAWDTDADQDAAVLLLGGAP